MSKRTSNLIGVVALTVAVSSVMTASGVASAGVWQTSLDWTGDASLTSIFSPTQQSDWTHAVELVGAASPYDDVAGVTVGGVQFTAREINSGNFQSMGTPVAGADINSGLAYSIASLSEADVLKTYHDLATDGLGDFPSGNPLSNALATGDLYVDAGGDFKITLSGLVQNMDYCFYFFHVYNSGHDRPYTLEGLDDGTGTNTIALNGNNSSRIMAYKYNTGSSTSFTMTFDWAGTGFPMHFAPFANYLLTTPANIDVTPESRSGDPGYPIARAVGETIVIANTAAAGADAATVSGINIFTYPYDANRFSVSGIVAGDINPQGNMTGTVAFDKAGLLNGLTVTGAYQFTVAGKTVTAQGEGGDHFYSLSAPVVAGNTGNGTANIAATGSYAGLYATDSGAGSLGGFATEARFLAGSNTGGRTAELNVKFDAYGGYAGDPSLLSDIVTVTGIGGTTFVLQLSYDPSLLGGGAPMLAYWDGSAWANAVEGNSTVTPDPVARGYQAGDENLLGRYGYDLSSGVVWAVLDHNSDFAAVVPEPTSAVLVLLGLAGLAIRRRRAGR